MSDDNHEAVPEPRREEDTIKILLATDIHLGYEHSTKRLQENDSFITFEEILEHAKTEDVDFVLLGGDLFHDSKPSQKVIMQCVELLKKYALGDREIKVEFLSNPEVIFSHSSQRCVNYEDPNMNISMPIFSIHGNHDNPSFVSTGSMDILGASGLINYFGKWTNLTHVTIAPLVFKKGKTYVSIYGFSYMNDQRLSRLIRDEKFTLLRPAVKAEPFKILVLHQNRAKHTENGYVDEKKLPGLLDLIFWGHEHECRVDPEEIINTETSARYHICQPGSSIATSLCEGEAVQKKIGVLKINKQQFKIKPIKLQTVRPFIFDSISLREMDIKMDLTRPRAEVICSFVEDYIDNVLLARVQKKLTGHPKQPTIPLIRLRIFYTEDCQVFDTMRLMQKYCDTIANPRDIIIFRKEKGRQKVQGEFDRNTLDDEDIKECFRVDDDDMNWNKTVQGQIKKFFASEDKKNHLTVLSVAGLNEALKRFVETGDDDAFRDVVNHQVGKTMEYMKKFDMVDDKEIVEQLKIFRDERIKREDSEDEEQHDVNKFLDSDTRKKAKPATQAKTVSVSRDDSDVEAADNISVDDPIPKPTRGRGRGSRGGARAAKATTTRGRGTARGRGKAVAAKPSLDVNFSLFEPKANSSMKPTSSVNNADTILSQFRAKTSTQSQRQPLFMDDSDSD